MMKEIGGYIELDRVNGAMLHEGARALNCGRNALAYLIEAKNIKAIALPYYLCTSVREVCEAYGLRIRYYHIRKNFETELPGLYEDEWLYFVNYYGQLDEERLRAVKARFGRVIIDNAQAYFAPPCDGIDTIYTCRKFFGVADGAFLFTDAQLKREIPTDISYDRMEFLLGRYEGRASDFYRGYAANNSRFSGMEIRRMSALTENLLRRIDYDEVKKKRTRNFEVLSEHFMRDNELTLRVPEGAFAYPLMLPEAKKLRQTLISEKIYIPLLWPNVADDAGADSTDAHLAEQILPIPCDQRYDEEVMSYICGRIDALRREV